MDAVSGNLNKVTNQITDHMKQSSHEVSQYKQIIAQKVGPQLQKLI